MTFGSMNIMKNPATNEKQSEKQLMSEILARLEHVERQLESLRTNLEATGTLADEDSKLMRNERLIDALAEGMEKGNDRKRNAGTD